MRRSWVGLVVALLVVAVAAFALILRGTPHGLNAKNWPVVLAIAVPLSVLHGTVRDFLWNVLVRSRDR